MNHLPRMKYRHRVLFFLCLLAAITYLDRIAISVAGPRIQQSLNLTPEMWGWVVGIFTISYGLFEIPTGRMGDRKGARSVLTRIVLWWSAFTSFTGLASNFYFLLITRFAFGVGEAGAFPNIAVSMARWIPSSERARAMGFVFMSAQIGGALAPLLIVPVQIRYGWRSSFYLLGVIGVVWCIAWYRWYRDTPQEKVGVTEAEIKEIGAPSFSDNHSLPWGKALRKSNLWALMFVGFSYVFALYFFISWLHTFLVKGRGFSETQLLLTTAPAILGAVGNICGGFISDGLVKRFGKRWGRSSLGVVSLGCSALFTVATILTTNKALTLLFLGLVYAGITLQQTVCLAVVMDVSGKYVGGILGTTNMCANAGGFIFSVSFGYFVRWFGSYDLALIPVALMLMASSLTWLKIDATDHLFDEQLPEVVPDVALTAVT